MAQEAAPSPPAAAAAPPRRWSTKVVAAVGAIALAVLGGAVGAGFSLWLAPQQQVRQQNGLDAAQAHWDATTPAILVENARYGDEIRSATTSRVLEPGQFTQDLSGSMASGDLDSSLLPPGEDVQPGPIDDYEQHFTGAPRVYDDVLVTLVGNHYRPVKVTDVAIHVVSRQTPPAGTLVYAGPQGGGPSESIGFDLDSLDLTARADTTDTSEPHATARHYFNDRQVTVDRQEQLDLKLVVFTKSCLCRFTFTISTDDGGRYTVDDHGRPWQVSAFAPHYARSYGLDVNGPSVVGCSWPDECVAKYA